MNKLSQEQRIDIFFKFLREEGVHDEFTQKVQFSVGMGHFKKMKHRDFVIGAFPWGEESEKWNDLHHKWLDVIRNDYSRYIELPEKIKVF